MQRAWCARDCPIRNAGRSGGGFQALRSDSRWARGLRLARRRPREALRDVGWQIKMLIPLGAVLLALQGLAEVLRCILCLRDKRWLPRLHDVEELEKQLAEQARARAPQ